MAAGRMLFVLLVLAGCGGISGREGESSGESDAGSSAGARGGSAGAATSGASGTNAAGSGNGAGMAGGGMPGACSVEDCGFVTVDDFDTTGWLPGLHIAGSSKDEKTFIVSLEPPRDDSRFALHLAEAEELGGAALSFHMHIPIWAPDPEGLGEPYVGVRFWAKRGESGPLSLVVAITGLAQESSDYTTDLEAGRPWLARRFALTTDWQRYFALFREFGPEGNGETMPPLDASGQVVHFLVPSGEPLDLWLDDIEFACAPGTCP